MTPRILFRKETAPRTFEAIAGMSGERGWTLQGSAKASEKALPVCDNTESVLGIVSWYPPYDCAEFRETFVGLWRAGARRFVLFSPCVGEDRPWDELPPRHQGAFGAAFSVCRSALQQELARVISSTCQTATPDWAELRLQATADAIEIHSHLRSYTHGARNDLANQFLGPARVLLLDEASKEIASETTRWHKLWDSFRKSPFFRSDNLSNQGALGLELDAAAKPIDRWLMNDGAIPCAATELARFMALLTECRVAAGQRSSAEAVPNEKDRPCLPLCALCKRPGHPYRVLVVDDHAAAWRPVFQRVQLVLASNGLDVEFEFSFDGQHVAPSEEKAGPAGEDGAPPEVNFGYYDLIILDVFLGGERDGRAILQDTIRRDWPHLPVLLWTTSRDDEVTRKAFLANNVLLKKTVTTEELTDNLSHLLPEGRAKGVLSLPSVFLNHQIHKEEYRNLARDFTDWCLKQLDSFHALDSTYFRYFTDHGGRHIMKFFELLEQALQPFLGDRRTDVFSADGETREFEFLALHLAVLCHELGMFPMKVGDEVERFGGKKPAYLDNVRSLHALRGLLLFFDATNDTGQYWNDDEGRKLGARLKVPHPQAPGVQLGDMVATLVGYHARCLTLLTEDEFLKWSADKRFGQLREPHGEPLFKGKVYQQALSALDRKLHAESEPTRQIRERLRRQCALARFVDAIDICRSRNPALFLLHDPDRSPANNREHLKRQLTDSLTIRNGSITIKFLACVPEVATLACVLANLTDDVSEGKRLFRDGDTAAAAAHSIVESLTGGVTCEAAAFVKRIQKPLDQWLEETWCLAMTVVPKEGPHKQHVCRLRVLSFEAEGASTVTGEGKKLIASLTALSVLGELLDEYGAIQEGGLGPKQNGEQGGIGLPWANWVAEERWENTLPEELTILGVGLKDYSVKS